MGDFYGNHREKASNDGPRVNYCPNCICKLCTDKNNWAKRDAEFEEKRKEANRKKMRDELANINLNPHKGD